VVTVTDTVLVGYTVAAVLLALPWSAFVVWLLLRQDRAWPL
jgi:hypothetical protein